MTLASARMPGRPPTFTRNGYMCKKVYFCGHSKWRWGGKWYKTFMAVSKLRLFTITQSLCLWQAFPAYPSESPSCASLWGRLQALPAKGWKGLPVTNALAYYEKSWLTATKSFITLAAGGNLTKKHVPNLRMFVISQSVCAWKAFTVWSNVNLKTGAYPHVG